MLHLIARRILRSIPLVLLVSAVTFFVESLVPGNTARTLVGVTGTQAQYEQLRVKLGLNKPLWDQYVNYIWHLLHGNFGVSAFSGESVAHQLWQRLPVTLSIVLVTTLFCAIVGVSLGVLAALKGGLLGKLLDGLSVLGFSLPNFWVALLLVSVLSIDVHVFPATGYVSIAANPLQWLVALVLPAVSLGLGPVAIVAKQSRDSMKETLSQDYIRTLRAAGLPRRSVVWRHALRNASIPTVTVLGLVFVSALSASVFIETVFVLPGLGSLAVTATTQHDIPIIEGITIYFTLLVVTVNLVLDMLYGVLDPKVRLR
jgi:peptide/nickel transport system permease protein